MHFAKFSMHAHVKNLYSRSIMGRWDDDEEAPRGSGRGTKANTEQGRNTQRANHSDSREASNRQTERSRSRSRSRSPARWGKADESSKAEPGPDERAAPPKPEFGLSGLLAAETNTTAEGVVLKHQEPAEKGLPSKKWRIYVFKDGKPLEEPLMIHHQSNYLFGRDRRVADIATDHPSCSLQHAVIQYRTTDKRGVVMVRPYLMDLNSTNGTLLNGEKLDPERYYELLPKDVVTFGESTREYVILTE